VLNKHAQDSSDEDDFILPSPPILPQPEHQNKHKKSKKALAKSSSE